MTVLERTAVVLNVESDCRFDTCSAFARDIYEQLAVPRYSISAALMPVPESVEVWEQEHRTARKQAWRAERLGYTVGPVDFVHYSDDIFEINTSAAMRQGRPMTEGYTRWIKRSSLSDLQTRCDRHRTTTFGVIQGRRLRAYSTVHRRGDLAMISMILGHGDHQTAGIMYLLMRGMVAHEAGQGGWFFYNTWASGTEGLRFKKARYGFAPSDIEWVLS